MKIKDSYIVDEETGEVLGSSEPRFLGWSKEGYEEHGIRGVTPMTAQELDKDKLEKYLDEHIVVYEQKFDGHRAIMHMLNAGNRVFSRNVSKKSHWFTENSDQVPQLRDLVIPVEYLSTIIDGEVLVPQQNCSCRGVQSVMGALPETAIQNQLEQGFAYIEAFDILKRKDINTHRMRYWRRKLYLLDVVLALDSPYVKFAPMYMDNKTWELYKSLIPKHLAYLQPYLAKYVHIVDVSPQELCNQFMAEDKEGIMIKDIYGRYEEKRSKNYIKMKGHKTYDVVIMGYEEPEHYFEGKTLREGKAWDYWEDPSTGKILLNVPLTHDQGKVRGLLPVTKFHAKNWLGAIKIGVWKEISEEEAKEKYGQDFWGEPLEQLQSEGVIRVGKDMTIYELIQVGRTSGFSEDIREEISTRGLDYLGTVIEVEAQQIINSDTGSLQHPRFVQFRIDKNSEDCTFNDHIRRYGEEDVHR